MAAYASLLGHWPYRLGLDCSREPHCGQMEYQTWPITPPPLSAAGHGPISGPNGSPAWQRSLTTALHGKRMPSQRMSRTTGRYEPASVAVSFNKSHCDGPRRMRGVSQHD